jgi:hypothetical protein
MQEIRCYRVRRSSDWIIRLEPDREAPSQPLVLLCEDGVRVGRSATGDTLLYRDGPYGVQPDQAIRLGWGRLLDGDAESDDKSPRGA